MSTDYKPDQKLSFLFKKNKKALYIKSRLTVDVNSNESIDLTNDPKMAKETTIELKTVSSQSSKSKHCKKEILIPVLENLDNVETEAQIRDKIAEDLSAKKISKYKVKTKVIKNGEDVGGQKTTTISGDAIIKIE